jgi:cell division protein FtsI (penicillin-binding protein 3)
LIGARPRVVSSQRLNVAIGLMVAVLAALLLRLVWLQCVQHDMWAGLAARAHFAEIKIPADRGFIVDRNLRPLAVTLKVDSIWANPRAIADPRGVSYALARILKMDASRICVRLTRERYFIWIKRKVTPAEALAVAQARIWGVGLIPENRRFYCDGALAAHITGFVDIDDKGRAGIETQFDRLLAGVPGYQVVNRDGLRRSVASRLPCVSPQNGNSIILTIDSRIQAICREEVVEAVTKFGAQWAVGIVMDPNTGDILAMVSYPDYDPNSYSRATPDQTRNRCIADWYEPGSSFKPFTLAALLTTGAATPETRFFCENGFCSFGGHKVRDVHGYGSLTLKEVIVKSSNIGIIKSAALLGPRSLSAWLRAFEFGRKTGVELPGESAGLLRPLNQWTSYSMSSIPMGQEIAVTGIQLIKGFCTFANGGYIVKPRIVLGIATPDGKIPLKYFDSQKRQFLPEPIAKKIGGDILAEVVNSGTATSARLATYRIAGKTGTSQIALANGRGYEPGAFVGTFIGMAPVESPRFVALVSLGRPQRAHYGGTVSAPAVAQILERSLFAYGSPVVASKARKAGTEVVAHD